MSLLGRFLGGGRNKAYAEGVTHLEEGRFAAAVDCLRVAALGDSGTPSGSLASFHFRQALLREGRRLLRSEQKAAAVPYFAEAVKLWDQYPDLHCLLGAAQGLAGDWDRGLDEARRALRLNPDYAEARLLEAVALQQAERLREAADSLNKLVESGRRVDHWLIAGLTEQGPFTDRTLPGDLAGLLERSLSGQSEKEEVASAVALCRAGKWEDGLERFAALVERRPRYPDYRTRHAAALFQVGRNDQALAEVEAALALNDAYRTAVDLKGLILADTGRLREAAAFLAEADGNLADAKPASTHEAMFAAYLRAVLALLSGRPDSVRDVLGEWPELPRNFARAELLLAAAEDLTGQPAPAHRRLAALAAEWSAEPLYAFLLACAHLAHDRPQDLAGVLGRWPAAGRDETDDRPLYLEALMAVRQGRVPPMPDPAEDDRTDADADSGGKGDPAGERASGGGIDDWAWRLLRARSEFLQGADTRCWATCEALVAEGAASEDLVRLQTRAAVTATGDVPADWSPAPVLPAAVLAPAVHLAVNRDRADDAAGRVASLRRLQPEVLAGYWLDAAFWLQPVRGWIA
ncbi:hypothetical protein KDM41_14515 [bacterium]|nr:hypothetical protein [bacterium]